MSKDNGGESPQVRETGDAPQVTRLLNEPIDEGKTFLSSWSSPEKLAAHLKTVKSEDCWNTSNVWKSVDKSFCGVDNIHEAIDLAHHGWKEGGEIIERTRGYIAALNPLSPKLVKYGIAGTTPNVPRAIAGNLFNMRKPDLTRNQKRRTITIVYNMCEAWYANEAAISNKAAVVAALVDEIEGKGFACEVIACAKSGYSGRIKALTSVCVKESHQPVDINRLAFALGHAAMFRVFMFGTWQSDDFAKELGYGLGIVSTTLPTKDQNENNIFTITSGHYNNHIKIELFNTQEGAAKEGLNKIVSELQKQGCPAFEKKDHEDGLDEEPVEQEEEYHFEYS
jgi:hypothetical protein